MFRRLCQLAALAILGALLVYAPEIFTAVSAPYRVSTQSRVLLRVALCCEDSDTAASFYHALEEFRKAYPATHLRVVRTEASQLDALADPLPDIYLLPSEAFDAANGRFLPLEALDESASSADGVLGGVRYAVRYVPQKGTPLLCAVGAHTREAGASRALTDFLRSPDDQTQP